MLSDVGQPDVKITRLNSISVKIEWSFQDGDSGVGLVITYCEKGGQSDGKCSTLTTGEATRHVIIGGLAPDAAYLFQVRVSASRQSYHEEFNIWEKSESWLFGSSSSYSDNNFLPCSQSPVNHRTSYKCSIDCCLAREVEATVMNLVNDVLFFCCSHTLHRRKFMSTISSPAFCKLARTASKRNHNM